MVSTAFNTEIEDGGLDNQGNWRQEQFMRGTTEYGDLATGEVCITPTCRHTDRHYGKELVAQRRRMASDTGASIAYDIQLQRLPPNVLLVSFSSPRNLIFIIKIFDNI